MEDYQSAFQYRLDDTAALHDANRKSAAMHFGGITVECLLKAIILASLPRTAKPEWKTTGNNPGHTIVNPGHSLFQAIRCNSRLYTRVQNSKAVMTWLNVVENPGQHFIDVRYAGSEPGDEIYKTWFEAYQKLIHWLQKQATQL